MQRFIKNPQLRSEEIYLKLSHTLRRNRRQRWSAAYVFSVNRVLDGEQVGHCTLRISHTEKTFFGGNIGYEIYEEHRGNHYAAKACYLLYELARQHGMTYLIITCNPENIASRRTCELAGATLLATIDLPEDNDMYREGERQKCIYRVELI